MKRFFSALGFCTLLLGVLGFILFPTATAKTDPLRAFLDQPAPRPPYPLVKNKQSAFRSELLQLSRSKVPADDAPIEVILQYWEIMNSGFSTERHTPKPSPAVIDRLYAEIDKDPSILLRVLNVLPDDQRTTALAQQLYDSQSPGVGRSRYDQSRLKEWLSLHSRTHVQDLARRAAQVREDGEYLTNHEDLLALTHVDYDQAKPIIDRLYSNSSQKVPQVLAKWARYRHAIETNSLSDIETYRNELKAVVEDKSATAAMRDLALDGLIREKEWPERDEWYYSLLEDDTLADLQVNGRSFTGLTTMMLMTPEEKYIDKMIELVKSSNKTVRSAAARNLSLRLGTQNPDVFRALLPWLEDPKWVTDTNARAVYIRSLRLLNIPEAVPGLIKLLDERGEAQGDYVVYPAANRPAANRPAANAVANSIARSSVDDSDRFPFRMDAVEALAKLKDPTAAPPLRRVLNEADLYGRSRIVNAILACNGFTINEQLDGLQAAALGVSADIDIENADDPSDANAANHSANAMRTVNAAMVAVNAAMVAANAMANATAASQIQKLRPLTPEELRTYVGQALMQQSEISDDLASAIVDRIETIEAKEPKTAAAYRRIVLRWQNSAINALLIRDLKRGIYDVPAMNRMIGQRAQLRQKHGSELMVLRSVNGVPAGLASCIFESREDNASLIESDDAAAKVALFGCARLIRSPLPVAKVAAEMRSANALLKLAAERYLETEDSPAARAAIRASYPKDVKVLGARSCFQPGNAERQGDAYLEEVFRSVELNDLYGSCPYSPTTATLIKTERALVDEIKKDMTMAAVYSFDRNHIRVYKDRAMFSWDEDDSRYRERPLEKQEFDYFTAYLERNNADEMPPFVPCNASYCPAKELLMIDRSGGRRVYFTSDPSGGTEVEFARELSEIFKRWKEEPSTLKYSLSREIPGLEVIFASDDLSAETVWKGDGSDLRIVGVLPSVRKSVKEKLNSLDEGQGEDEDIDYAEINRKRSEMFEKTFYEGYSWYRIANGKAEPGVAKPPQIDAIPPRDGHTVQPNAAQWKARAANIEIRASDDGLFKIQNGRMTRIRQGSYLLPVISPDGRWLLVSKMDEGMTMLARVDLVTNKETMLGDDSEQYYFPIAYVPFLNRFLIADYDGDGHDGYEAPEDFGAVAGDDPANEEMRFVDILSGKILPVRGEVRPLYQQSFRPLQSAAKPNEVWAAIPSREKNETVVGLYNAKTLAFAEKLRIPKIRFNSMQMWVDEREQKVFFVYRGHVLAMPLPHS